MSDMKGILRSTKKRDFVMYVVYLVETSIWRVMSDPKKYKRVPDAIVQTTIIFDLEGLSMQHVTNKQGILRFRLRVYSPLQLESDIEDTVQYTYLQVTIGDGYSVALILEDRRCAFLFSPAASVQQLTGNHF